MQKVIIPILATAFLLGVMLYQAKTIEPVLCELPKVRLTEISGFQSVKMEPSEAELHVLPADTVLDKRVYTDADNNWYNVSMVFGGRSKSSIHRPELCLPTQGFQMSNPRDLNVDGIDWHLVTLNQKDGKPQGFAYTFFNQEGFRTASHVQRIFCDVWDRSIRGRIDRWVMVTVDMSKADDLSISQFLRKLKGMME